MRSGPQRSHTGVRVNQKALPLFTCRTLATRYRARTFALDSCLD